MDSDKYSVVWCQWVGGRGSVIVQLRRETFPVERNSDTCGGEAWKKVYVNQLGERKGKKV
jgi:hypothetical protein